MSNAGERGETAGLGTAQRNALIVGAVLLIACTLWGVFSRTSFFRAYLIAFEFWLGISLGSMAVMMIRHLTGGAWGLYLRPILEASAILVPLMAVFFLPLLIGLPYLYPWHPNFVGGSQLATLPPHQQLWFDLWFFIGRAALYFVLWTGFAFLLNLGPRPNPTVPHPRGEGKEEGAGEETSPRLRGVSAVGLLVYGLTITFASLDWSMSIDAGWFSTIYGAMYAAGQLLVGFAFTVLVAALLSKGPPSQLFRDFGNLLLAFTMIWMYLTFSQFLLIWAGNLPDETSYFQPRMDGGWQWVALAILLGEFALPFLLLLLKRIKVSPRRLAVVAGISLAAHYLNLIWLTLPTLPDNGWDLFVLAPALLAGVGGVWLSLFLWRLQRRPFFTAAALHLEVPTYE